MGGNAFTSGPSALPTPRMPPAVYFALKLHYNKLLHDIYSRVATPIEAPDKISYGDIDFHVSGPTLYPPPSTEYIATHLGATRYLKTSGSPTTSFAVPYPELKDNFVQVDLHECSLATSEWQLFHQSYGDLWNLLGTTIRPFGLTANNEGFHLRIEQIEDHDRKKSLLLLTRDPTAVIDFLGLKHGKYGQSFERTEDLYDFVAKCRFFRAERYRKEGLKTNDRKRMKQREVFRRFVEEWIPKFHEDNQKIRRENEEPAQKVTRQEILEEALITFDKKTQYEGQLSEWKVGRATLLAKQQDRSRRKAEAAEKDHHANAGFLF